MKDPKKSTLNKLSKKTYPALHNAMYRIFSQSNIDKYYRQEIMLLVSYHFNKALEAGYDAGYKIGHTDGIRNERGLNDEVNSMLKAYE